MSTEYFLVIDGTPIDVQTDSGECEVVQIGDQDRAFSGDLLVRVDAEKREFPLIKTQPYTLEQYETLTSIISTGPKTVTGTIILGDSAEFWLTRSRIRPVANGEEVYFEVEFSLKEM